MKKAKIEMAAIVCHPETGKEFGVRHSIDVQGWLDLGYTLKGEKAKKVETKKEGDKPADNGPADNNDAGDNDTIETSFDDMSDEDFIEAVKDKLHDLKADEARRVAKIVGVEYTNKKDTMNIVEDKWSEDL